MGYGLVYSLERFIMFGWRGSSPEGQKENLPQDLSTPELRGQLRNLLAARRFPLAPDLRRRLRALFPPEGFTQAMIDDIIDHHLATRERDKQKPLPNPGSSTLVLSLMRMWLLAREEPTAPARLHYVFGIRHFHAYSMEVLRTQAREWTHTQPSVISLSCAHNWNGVSYGGDIVSTECTQEKIHCIQAEFSGINEFSRRLALLRQGKRPLLCIVNTHGAHGSLTMGYHPVLNQAIGILGKSLHDPEVKNNLIEPLIQAGAPIVINACRTGHRFVNHTDHKPFAQRLANATGLLVISSDVAGVLNTIEIDKQHPERSRVSFYDPRTQQSTWAKTYYPQPGKRPKA